MTPKQEQYLAELARCGSAVHARRAVGVTRRTVSNWEGDEAFAEAAAEAQELANAEILAKAREQAMAGDTSLLSTWMRALIPALRPQSSLAVGVQVNGTSRAGQLTDEELIERGRRVLADIDMRREVVDTAARVLPAPAAPAPAGGAVVDVQALPVPEAPEALSGPESEPESGDEGAVDDLL